MIRRVSRQYSGTLRRFIRGHAPTDWSEEDVYKAFRKTVLDLEVRLVKLPCTSEGLTYFFDPETQEKRYVRKYHFDILLNGKRYTLAADLINDFELWAA